MLSNGQITKTITTEDETVALAAKFAKTLTLGDVVFLQGDLGVGKTTFSRAVLRALDYKGKVKSPTYTIVESYALPEFTLHHFDLYRISDPEELELIGVRDYFNRDSVCFIEWPEKAQGFLPKATKKVSINLKDETREFVIC